MLPATENRAPLPSPDHTLDANPPYRETLVTEIDTCLKNARSALNEKRWADGEAQARGALRLSPTNAAALCMLGSMHARRGDAPEALRLYQQAVACNDKSAHAYHLLAQMLSTFRRMEESADAYRAWARLAPEDPEAQFMLAAATGAATPEKCSEGFVQTHFDQFSEAFDNVLINRLGYTGPWIVAAALARHIAAADQTLHVLDAGCGTGLCGRLLKPYCKILSGVDLSKKMVEKARERDCYDELTVSELCAHMEGRPDAFDAVISADVLVYFGALERVMSCAQFALKPGGLFIFTVEALSAEDEKAYRLQASGRYVHAEGYLREVLVNAGLQVLSLQKEFLRYEGRGRTMAYVVAAKKS